MFRFIQIAVLIPLVLFVSCSSNGTVPVSPPESSDLTQPIDINSTSGNHKLLGSWILDFDDENLSAVLVSDRSANLHYNVTSLIPTPIIDVTSWDPVTEILELSVVIHNPYMLDVYDLRLIIYTDNVGHLLLNEDNWTPLFDIPGGKSFNPFKAYGSNNPNRIFGRFAWLGEDLQIKCPGSNFQVRFAIDVSYPGNCEEPYLIEGFSQDRLVDLPGVACLASVNVLDWQDDVESVNLMCPAIDSTSFELVESVTPNEWTGELINNLTAPIGEYDGLITAYSTGSPNLPLYHHVIVTVRSSNNGWARTWGGSGADNHSACVCDDFGNIYIIGRFEEDIDFDPGSGEDIRYTSDDCAFVSKYTEFGVYQWTITWPDSLVVAYYPWDGGNSIAVDSVGSVYFTGYFNDTVDFDPGSGSASYSCLGGDDSFLCKFNSDGEFVWVNVWRENDDQWAWAVNVDSGDNLYLSGLSRVALDLDPGAGSDVQDGELGFVVKMDSEGNYLWGNRVHVGINALAVSEFDDLYTAGAYSGTVDFDPGPDEEIRTSANNDPFVCKFSSAGEFIWTATPDSIQSESITDIAVDATGNINTIGNRYHQYDIHTWKVYISFMNITPNGGLNFRHLFNKNFNVSYDGSSIVCDDEGHILIAIYVPFLAELDLNPDSSETDYFTGPVACISKYDSNGEYLWSRATVDSQNSIISIDNDSNIYMAGEFTQSQDFNPGPGEEFHTSTDYIDVFLMKLLPNGLWE